MHRVEVGHRPRGERVARLVVGGDPLLFVAHGAGLALGAGDDAVDRLLERLRGDQPAVLARGEQRGLVDDVGEVGAGEPGGAAGDHAEVDVLRERLALGVHPQHRFATEDVGRADGDLAVEAARTQQRRVEDVGPVGGRDQDHAALDVEAVHLDQQLVEGLLALVVAAAHAGAAVAADGIDLVDEHDGRRVGLGLLEQVTHAGGTDADEHLDEVRA